MSSLAIISVILEIKILCKIALLFFSRTRNLNSLTLHDAD